MTSDYCPHCRRVTQGIKDYNSQEYLCKRCGKISKLNASESFKTNLPKNPQKVQKNFVRWFKKRVV